MRSSDNFTCVMHIREDNIQTFLDQSKFNKAFRPTGNPSGGIYTAFTITLDTRFKIQELGEIAGKITRLINICSTDSSANVKVQFGSDFGVENYENIFKNINIQALVNTANMVNVICDSEEFKIQYQNFINSKTFIAPNEPNIAAPSTNGTPDVNTVDAPTKQLPDTIPTATSRVNNNTTVDTRPENGDEANTIETKPEQQQTFDVADRNANTITPPADPSQQQPNTTLDTALAATNFTTQQTTSTATQPSGSGTLHSTPTDETKVQWFTHRLLRMDEKAPITGSFSHRVRAEQQGANIKDLICKALEEKIKTSMQNDSNFNGYMREILQTEDTQNTAISNIIRSLNSVEFEKSAKLYNVGMRHGASFADTMASLLYSILHGWDTFKDWINDNPIVVVTDQKQFVEDLTKPVKQDQGPDVSNLEKFIANAAKNYGIDQKTINRS